MKRMTHNRIIGIEAVYWSSAKRDNLIQRLGEYEDTGLEPEQIEELKQFVNMTEDDLK